MHVCHFVYIFVIYNIKIINNMNCKITKNFIISTTILIKDAKDIDDAYRIANEQVKDLDLSQFVITQELDSQISDL